MRKLKKGLASLLAMMMLVSVLPVSALAEEANENTAAEVVFNLGTMEVTVGTDQEAYETAEVPYDLFDEDGNYTIALGPDAFFPYEVQFTCGGATWTEWFMDADDTVEVGGHTFSVETYVGDPAALTGLSFEIGGRTVTAYPAEKEFTNEGSDVALLSLLPLREESLTLDLTGFMREELKTVQASYLISAMQAKDDGLPVGGENDLVLCVDRSKTGDYTIVHQGETLDLYPYGSSGTYVNLNMIVGTADQLDVNNVLYTLRVTISSEAEVDVEAVYAEDRSEVTQLNSSYTTLYFDDESTGESVERNCFRIYADADSWKGGRAYLSLTSDFDSTDDPELDVKVYNGYYEDEEALANSGMSDVSDLIWDQDLTVGGYEAECGTRSSSPQAENTFTVVWERNGKIIKIFPVMIYITTYNDGISVPDYLYVQPDGGDYATYSYDTEYDETLKRTVYLYEIRDADYPAEGPYYAQFELIHNGEVQDDGAAYVEKAVAGDYATLEDAADAADIAADLFGEGYAADFSQGVTITIFLKNGTSSRFTLKTLAYEEYTYVDCSSYLYTQSDSTEQATLSCDWDYDYKTGMQLLTYEMKDGEHAVNGTYYARFEVIHNGSTMDDISAYVEKSVVGNYTTLRSASGAEDITEQLFGGGYAADYSQGVVFSIFLKDGELYQYSLRTTAYEKPQEPAEELPPAPEPDSQDTYFRMKSARAATENGTTEYLDYYVMPYEHDGYYYNGYQTVFLLNEDGSPVTAEKIVPTFYTGDKVTMYAGLDHASGTAQKSGETAVEFRNGETIQYSAAAESKGHLKNYWVTFLTQQTGGPSLFVNAANDPDRVDEESGLPVREVYLTPEFDFRHDVFFANIGDEAMNGIYVKLEDAENVALDDYWTVREDASDENRSLAAFTTTEEKDADGNWVYYGELPNVAKVRLVPVDGGIGDISGTLVIGYDNGSGKAEEIRIKLTGIAGIPKITTETILSGVKYVPYNSVIQTNNMGASDEVSLSVTDGSLPDGITLYPNGKLYGMPTRAGNYTFTVTAAYKGNKDLNDSKTFTITIKENTNGNVDAATDMGYTVLDRVPDTMTEYTDQVFRSEGTYSYFYKFYLDGRELTEGQDFDSEEGSTKITVRAQTFRNAGSGTHTIAAEFRSDKNDTNTVKRAAQNYTVSGGSSGSGSGTSKPAIKPPVTQPETPKTTADIFKDITAQDWYYADVDWAYQNKLMIGVTSDLYVPYGLISPATVVTVLARMDKVDLSRYDGVSYPEIADGQWYTNAAVWAKETGLLPEGTFSAVPPIARAKFAVMLVKYLESKGIDCTLPEAPVAFADAELMTQEENDAFQVLYQFGIFKGIGNYYMDPQGSTTRAQLAVLLHRLSVFVESHS